MVSGRCRGGFMTDRRIITDRNIHTFKLNCGKQDLIPGSKPDLVDDGEIYKIHIPGSKSEFHGGFQKKLLEIQTDKNNSIVQFYAVIDIFYVPPSYLVFEKDPVKLGTVNYSGNLVDGAQSNESKWNTQIIVSCPFNEKNSAGLPVAVLKVGPGAFITAIVQSLFGTITGIKLLGLEGYNIPDAEPGTNEIKITQ